MLAHGALQAQDATGNHGMDITFLHGKIIAVEKGYTHASRLNYQLSLSGLEGKNIGVKLGKQQSFYSRDSIKNEDGNSFH